ncbi:MAG: transcriptional repressor [Nitrospinota bacterium]|nr:MAG: transcriptional repressor [Nitrospinota bacterium]
MERQLVQIIEHLSAAGYRITKPRLEILKILLTTAVPMRVEEIFERIEDKRINLSSIYRSLQTFTTLGVLKKVNFHEDFSRYELSDHYREHHHHLVCQECGKIEDYLDCDLESIMQTAQEKYGFKTTAHDLELYGVCSRCQQ